MLIDALDGNYYLLSRQFDGDPPDPPQANGIAINTAPSIASISTLSTWEPVDVTFNGMSRALTPEDPINWEGSVTSTFEMPISGHVWFADQEFAPIPGDEDVWVPAGAYTLQVRYRSADFQAATDRALSHRLGREPSSEPAYERHAIYLIQNETPRRRRESTQTVFVNEGAAAEPGLDDVYLDRLVGLSQTDALTADWVAEVRTALPNLIAEIRRLRLRLNSE